MLKKLLLASALFAMTMPAEDRIYELRTYTAVEGRIQDVVKRFRDHTVKLLEKHGMQNIGYWVPADPPRNANTLIYIVSHKNRDSAKASWDAFRADPVWIKARDESEKNGKIVDNVVSVFMTPTDFSKLR